MPPDEAANDDPGGGCPVFPPPFRGLWGGMAGAVGMTIADLTMKPEITAPGGSIYGVQGMDPAGTSYQNMSGTSMASPQVAGMAALVAGHIRSNQLDEKTGVSSRHLIQSLLMSTAKPLQEEASGGNYWSILRQGAGLAHVGSLRSISEISGSSCPGSSGCRAGWGSSTVGRYSLPLT